jgi:hypothetical protein
VEPKVRRQLVEIFSGFCALLEGDGLLCAFQECASL